MLYVYYYLKITEIMENQSNLNELLKRVYTTAEIQEDLITLLSADPNENLKKNFINYLKVAVCPETGKNFLCCDFNEYRKAYRSPYTNQFVPKIDGLVEGVLPSRSLREVEIRANAMLEDYKDSFYKGGTCSAYIKETSERSYSVCFAIKKNTNHGSTDVTHVIELLYDGHHKILFKLVTRLLVTVNAKGFKFQESLCKNLEEGLSRMEDSKLELAHMLKMIENMEGNLKRQTANFIQSKTMQIANACRFVCSKNQRNRDIVLLKNLWSDQSRSEIEENKLSG